MLEIVCFKWRQSASQRGNFGPETVNTLRSMLERHYRKPHRLSCITDDARGIDHRVRIIPLWKDYATIKNPMGAHKPSCYRRLKLFSKEAASIVGERFAVLDLDTVIVADMAPILDRSEDFLIWGDTQPKPWYNASLWILTAGARTQVWETFDPKRSPAITRRAGLSGSDQAWMTYCLGPNEMTFGKGDGIYSYRVHIRPTQHVPENARVIMFHGKHNPWSLNVQHYEFVRQHYR